MNGITALSNGIKYQRKEQENRLHPYWDCAARAAVNSEATSDYESAYENCYRHSPSVIGFVAQHQYFQAICKTGLVFTSVSAGRGLL